MRSRTVAMPHGPWPVESDGSFWFPVADRRNERVVFHRASGEDYSLVMARQWALDRGGYSCTWVWDVERKRGFLLYLHRVIARAAASVQVDHIHGDLTDARRCALRWASPSQNSANTRRGAHPVYPMVRFRGVTIHRQTGKYQAAAKYLGHNFYLGLFDDAEEAARAYDAKARELWGPFALLNFPDKGEAAARVAA